MTLGWRVIRKVFCGRFRAGRARMKSWTASAISLHEHAAAWRPRSPQAAHSDSTKASTQESSGGRLGEEAEYSHSRNR